MSVQELKAEAAKHWAKWLPEKVARLKKERRLSEELQAAANHAQTEIEQLMQHQGYSISEAREVVLPKFILLPPEDADSDLTPEQKQELADKEREYQKSPPAF